MSWIYTKLGLLVPPWFLIGWAVAMNIGSYGYIEGLWKEIGDE